MDGGTGKRENKGGVPQGPGFRVDGKHHRRTGESCRDGRRAAPERQLASFNPADSSACAGQFPEKLSLGSIQNAYASFLKA